MAEFVEDGAEATELGQCPFDPGSDSWKVWQHSFARAQQWRDPEPAWDRAKQNAQDYGLSGEFVRDLPESDEPISDTAKDVRNDMVLAGMPGTSFSDRVRAFLDRFVDASSDRTIWVLPSDLDRDDFLQRDDFADRVAAWRAGRPKVYGGFDWSSAVADVKDRMQQLIKDSIKVDLDRSTLKLAPSGAKVTFNGRTIGRVTSVSMKGTQATAVLFDEPGSSSHVPTTITVDFVQEPTGIWPLLTKPAPYQGIGLPITDPPRGDPGLPRRHATAHAPTHRHPRRLI